MNEPDRYSLHDAAWINLSRRPETPTAQALTAAAIDLIQPHLDRKRTLGGKGLATLRHDLGIVLAGVMRPGLQGVPVRAHQSSAGDMWERSPVGHLRFWGVIRAMERAGLAASLASIRTPGPNQDGQAARGAALWPTEALEALAAAHGVTVDTRKADWRSDPTVKAQPSPLARGSLVTCRPFKGGPLEMGVTPDMEADFGAMREDLHALNALNGAADIRGAGHTVAFVRRFRHSAGFGGRFYAPVVNLSPEDRQRITINGEPVAEVDVKASQLTVLLGITGQTKAPRDAYEVPEVPRAVVKAWCIQTLGAGSPATRWSQKGAGVASGLTAPQVGRAVLQLYPFLNDLPALVSPELMAGVTTEGRSRASGQWVVQREASAISQAAMTLSRAGVVVLPVHDSLIVPLSRVKDAEDALHGAYFAKAGVVPRLEVATSSGNALRDSKEAA